MPPAPLHARDRTLTLHPYQSHLIVYVLDDRGVLIVRILHGRLEWERHL
jgi:toxin ParE1/3/4